MSVTVQSSPTNQTSTNGVQTSSRSLNIALAGNPNAGKTTLFNALTGLRQKVANYPGVTVERKEGTWAINESVGAARLIDLPGLYSLDAASIDEQIARDVITGKIKNLPAPDCVVAVVDATNLSRNLYLVTQILEFGVPVVVALTMVDLAEKMGIEIDVEKLSEELGAKVVAINVNQKIGLKKLSEAVLKSANTKSKGVDWKLSEEAEEAISFLISSNGHAPIDRHTAINLLYGEEQPTDAHQREMILKARENLQAKSANFWQQPLLARYAWIERIVSDSVTHKQNDKLSTSQKIDHILTHKIFGPAILFVVLLLIFQTIFSFASLPMDLIEKGFGALGDLVKANMSAGLLTDLLVDGVIAGVGGVVVFLPQILLLFFFISILEDTGYMSRAAFLMDKLMHGVGLHGKAFVPLLSSFACAIPGIMATRTIENPKDRLATILIAPFMSCSARLPVYTLMIAAFFSGKMVFGFISLGALLIMAMYLLGIAVAVAVAWILKRTILKAPAPPLVMELPPYRAPNFLTIFQLIVQRAGLFLKRAGTVILAISIILWALATFPRMQKNPALDETTQKSEQMRNSFAGRAGHLIEPVIEPLGFDWKMGVALIASFAAREVLVSTLSIIYNVGDDAESESIVKAVQEAKREDGTQAWTPLTALTMMVFFVLACQCMSTLAIVRRETNSLMWPAFMFVYMTVLAYIVSLIVYQGGRFLGFA
jgi:ferrous iron transport protein B